MDTQTAPILTPVASAATVDAGTIRLGAAMRRPANSAAETVVSAASVADSGRIRLGAAMRVPGRRHG